MKLMDHIWYLHNCSSLWTQRPLSSEVHISKITLSPVSNTTLNGCSDDPIRIMPVR